MKNKDNIIKKSYHIALVSIITTTMLCSCNDATKGNDISTTGSAIETSVDRLTPSDNRPNYESDIMNNDIIDLTHKTGNELAADIYWLATNAKVYDGQKITFNGYCLNTENAFDNVDYHNIVVTTDIYLEEGKTADFKDLYPIGFEYELADGNYPEDGVYVNVTGVISTYNEKGENNKDVFYAILKDVSINVLSK